MVFDRGSVVIGGGEAKTAVFYYFSLKLKYFVFNFNLIFNTCVYLIALQHFFSNFRC